MTDSYRKRQWAGEPIKDLRRVVPEPPRVPPHKKPRNYKLTVRYTTTVRKVYEQSFTSKAARDEFAAKVRRELASKNHTFALWQYMAETESKEVDGPHFEESIDGLVTSGPALRRSGEG